MSLCLTQIPIFTSNTGIRISVPLVDVLEDNCWEMKIVEQKDNACGWRSTLFPPPPSAATRWPSSLSHRGADGCSPAPPNDIYMLFNPWCEGTESTEDKCTRFPLIYINEVTPHRSVSPQMIPCIWIMKRKGRSMFWIAWAEFTTEPSSKLETERGILPRCGNTIPL